MSKRTTATFIAAAATALLIAVAWSFAAASPAASAPTAATGKVVKIVMKDPGCHWFFVGGKDKKSLTVRGATTFRNLDEAALTFKGPGLSKKVSVGKTLTVAKKGTYHIKMVGQKPDDNTLKLVVK